MAKPPREAVPRFQPDDVTSRLLRWPGAAPVKGWTVIDATLAGYVGEPAQLQLQLATPVGFGGLGSAISVPLIVPIASDSGAVHDPERQSALIRRTVDGLESLASAAACDKRVRAWVVAHGPAQIRFDPAPVGGRLFFIGPPDSEAPPLFYPAWPGSAH